MEKAHENLGYSREIIANLNIYICPVYVFMGEVGNIFQQLQLYGSISPLITKEVK